MITSTCIKAARCVRLFFGILGSLIISVTPLFSQTPVPDGPSAPFTIFPDRVVQKDGAEAAALSPTSLKSSFFGGVREWHLSKDLSGLPVLRAPGMPLLETLYNLSLEEALKDIAAPGLFIAGEKWLGTWTRDTAYSLHLSLAMIFPEIGKTSLRIRVNGRGEVIQDTGTGGSWPVSTDRVAWALGAWEIYKTTGDKQWLSYAYGVLKTTAERDRAVAFDTRTGLYFGETTFMDWREQTYPEWMRPADIFEAPALGTNALHKELFSILAEMGRALGAPFMETALWKKRAEELETAINNRLWLKDKKLFAQFRFPALSGDAPTSQTDTLGNALTVLFHIAAPDRAKTVIASLPVVPFGPPVIYPQLEKPRAYHNRAIWPFVTAYYAWAAARTGNETAVVHALSSNLRAAALFLSNKENMSFDTGEEKWTIINSNRQLWSVAGQLAGVYRLLFGIETSSDGMSFTPLVPAFIEGGLRLQNFPYRGAVLDISVRGRGAKVLSLKVNGQEKGAGFVLPSTASGLQKIEIVLDDRPLGGTIVRGRIDALAPSETFGSHPLPPAGLSALEAEAGEFPSDRLGADNPGFSGTGYVMLEKEEGIQLSLDLEAERPGVYGLRFRYANANGPVTTDKKCALRTLLVDGQKAGTAVFPQRGDDWSDFGYSNTSFVTLGPGKHRVQLVFLPENENMDEDVNQAAVDSLEFFPLKN